MIDGWISSSLGAVLERAEREKAAAEQHAAECTARPCERCERFVCRCGAHVDGAQTCPACDAADRLERLMRPTRESVPSHFRWALDATPETLSARVQGSAELTRRGLESPPSASLVFLGQTGTGKTSLAVAMLGAWVRQAPANRTGAMFVEASSLARARARHRLGEESPQVLAALSAPLLVIDDLGNEREDRDGAITDVVYGRSNADRPTWVTCGLQPKGAPLSPDEHLRELAAILAARYDGGFVRRLLEHGRRVNLGGKP